MPTKQLPILFIIVIIGISFSLYIVTRKNDQILTQQAAGLYYPTLPPGSVLPSDAECASRVIRNPWEPRPDNTPKNNINEYKNGNTNTGSATYLQGEAPEIAARITGNFTGTTDEIFQWAACKWGFDINTVRAQAVQESYWHQSQLGDSAPNTQPGLNGNASVGILQVKGGDIPPTHPGTWPFAWDSTSWNVDYTLAVRRACFEGKDTWLGNGYAAGDLWGCIGRWFSGGWHDAGAENYIALVKQHVTNQEWNTFGAGPAPTFPPAPSGTAASPTPTISSGTPTITQATTGTSFSVTLCPHGLGNCGDNVNPTSGNTNPTHTQRTVTVTILDATNNQIAQKQGQLTYNVQTQNFQGTISGVNIASGNYLITLKMNGFLKKQLPGIISVTQGTTVSLPAISAVNGDINDDNQLDILDYNLIIGCFGTKQTTPSCTTPPSILSAGANITDSGMVNGADYNLFLRELSTQKGG